MGNPYENLFQNFRGPETYLTRLTLIDEQHKLQSL